MNNCEQIRELIEAYALGALDADERTDLDVHLASGCVNCRTALEEARWLVSQLAYLASDKVPSPLLKERLMQTVRAESAASRRSVFVFRSPTIWTWIGVAALVVFTLYSGREMRHLRDQTRQAKSNAAEAQRDRLRLEEQLVLAQREVSILTDPASLKITLRPQNPQTPALEGAWQDDYYDVLADGVVGGPRHEGRPWLPPIAAAQSAQD